MKELYFEAEMDIVEFYVDEIINTSDAHGYDAVTFTNQGIGGQTVGPAGDAFL